MLSADPTGSCSLWRLDNSYRDEIIPDNIPTTNIWISTYQDADMVDCLPNDNTDVEYECDDFRHSSVVAYTDLTTSIKVDWNYSSADSDVHYIFCNFFITSAT